MPFTDDFNRADGPLGTGWTTIYGNPAIAGNQAVLTGYDQARCDAINSAGDQDVTITVRASGGVINAAGLVMNAGGANNYYITVAVGGNSGYPQLTVQQYNGATFLEILNDTGPQTFESSVTFRVKIASGNVTGWVDGTEVASEAAPLSLDGPYVYMYGGGATATIDTFGITDIPQATIVVTPDPLWVGGGQQMLTATGTGTAWTPGQPGSTTISADHGTVDLQEVTSATECVFLFTPAEYIGAITFTESEYGAQDTINAVAIMPEGYGGAECRLTPEGAALINDTAEDTPLTYKLWRRDTLVGTTPIDYTQTELFKSLADFLITNGWLGAGAPTLDWSVILRAINGGTEPPIGPYQEPAYATLSMYLDAIAQQIADVQGPGGVTLAVLAAALSDLRGVGSPSIKDVLDAVGNVNNDDVMAYLQAFRGNDVVTLTQVVAALTNIQTLNGYDLGTIVDRLDDRPTTLNMNAAFAVTNGAIGGLALEIAGLYKGLGLVEATNIFDTIAGIVGDIFSGLGQEVVDQFLDSIFGPDTPLPQIVLTPPIWPGLSRANVGNAVALQNGQTIDGPLHGLLFTIDQQPTEKYAYHFGNVRSWGRVGAVIFATDRGDYERSQTFALDTQVLCPQQMAVADHAIIKVNSGWGGTVRPWTIAQPQSP